MAPNALRHFRAPSADSRRSTWRAIADASVASAMIVAAVVGVFALIDVALSDLPTSLARSAASHVARMQ